MIVIARGLLSTLLSLSSAIGTAVAGQASTYKCTLEVHSIEGGTLEVTTGEEWVGIHDGAQISWRPPSSNPAIDLTLGYNGSSLESLSAPTGGHFRAILANGARPSDVAIIIDDGGSGHWRFLENDAARGPFAWRGSTFEGGFTKSDARGRAIIRSLEEYGHLRIAVSIRRNFTAIAEITSANIGARDALLDEARRAISRHDPSVCTQFPSRGAAPS